MSTPFDWTSWNHAMNAGLERLRETLELLDKTERDIAAASTAMARDVRTMINASLPPERRAELEETWK